jgi:hypothetical protein
MSAARTSPPESHSSNHVGAVLACDFVIVVTATFQRLSVFVLLDVGCRWMGPRANRGARQGPAG